MNPKDQFNPADFNLANNDPRYSKQIADFQLMQVLGVGGFGKVYLAKMK